MTQTMVPPLKQLADLLDPRRADQRGALRRDVRGVTCSAGRIIDFSLTGMRLQTRRQWPAGVAQTVTLAASPVELTLPATGVWSRREGWWKHIVGVAFENLTPEQRGMLLRLVDAHAVRSPLNMAN